MADGTQRRTGNSADPADTGSGEENAGEETGLPKAAPAALDQVKPPELPELPVPLAKATILLVAGAIAMGETNRLVTGALTPAGESRGVTDVVGMAALRGTDAWSDWLLLPDGMRRSVAVWIFFHALFDIALYLGYWLLLRRLLEISRSRSRSRFRSPSSAPRRTLWLLLALEIGETALLWLGSALLSGGWVPGLYRAALAGVATAKWLTGAVLVIVLLADEDVRATVRQGVVRVWLAVWEQRLSFVVVTVVGVLTLVPLPNIWDQLPDVERSWFDGDLDDVLHPVWAMVTVAVVSLYLFVVGRLFSERVWTTWVGNPPRGPQPPQGSPNWWWWSVPPVLTLVTAALLTVLPVDGLVDWQNVRWVVVVPLVILALSELVCGYYRLHKWLQRHPQPESRDRDPGWWQRRWRGWLRQWLEKDRALWREPPEREDRDRAMDTWVAGDMLAVSVVAMAGLGLVRSLIAPVLLGPLGGAMGTWIVRVVVLLAGAALAGVTFPLAKALLSQLDRISQLDRNRQRPRVKRRLRPDDNWRPDRPRPGRVLALALWLIAMAALAALMVWPLQLSQWFGVVAMTLLGLGLWAAVLGLLMAQLQDQRPLPIFATMRLRATPVLTLLLVLPLLASQAGGDPDVHALSGPPGGAPAAIPNRPSLSEAFADWLDRSRACDRLIDATDGQTVRPMVLVAASGGGIRSAVWTARVMDRLRAGGDCASHAVFLSSGLSGGSVGLAVSRGEDPTGDAEELAKPDALAAGIVGTLVGDIIAGSSGLRIPSRSLVDEDGNEPAGRERWDWRDRAGLMEAAWEAKAESLTARFDERLSGPAGVLVMNSTAAGRGCRVFVSQIELATGPQQTGGTAGDTEEAGSSDSANCQGQTDQPPASLDLQDIYGDCMPDMSWATAAMLSARFATLTPGARVPPVTRSLPPGAGGTGTPERVSCGGWPGLQLIDGGYAEGSGIGTLADIAPALLEVVRDHNATLSSAEPLVVPVVLYLEDETRSDIVRQPQGLSAELFVPLAGRSAKFVQTSSGTWLQRMAGSIADPCPTVDRQRCLDADAAVQGKLSGGIIIAAPLTKPSVEAPLGWTLSEDSRNRLKVDAEAQATECPPASPGGYPCLKQLLDVLEPDQP